MLWASEHVLEGQLAPSVSTHVFPRAAFPGPYTGQGG